MSNEVSAFDAIWKALATIGALFIPIGISVYNKHTKDISDINTRISRFTETHVSQTEFERVLHTINERADRSDEDMKYIRERLDFLVERRDKGRQ